jgi:steroid delta-isomerase-like uncharacterized protein
MKHDPLLLKLFTFFIASMLITASCTTLANEKVDSVETNIKMYTHIWDEIINKRNLAMFNDSNFTANVVMHTNPDIVGIDSARAYYANYLTGFSNIQFTIVDVFGEGNKLVKHWNFKGTHTGMFFSIPATGKNVNIDGVTLVRMENGKIAEERDFVDNYDLLGQLGQLSSPK